VTEVCVFFCVVGLVVVWVVGGGGGGGGVVALPHPRSVERQKDGQ
jgi:hypothetical protein